MGKKNNHFGLILFLIGILLLINHFHFIHFDVWSLWPLILLYIGIKAERDYFAGYKTSRSLLIGATLTTYSVYFLMEEFVHYSISNMMWPLFILGPALGFLQMAYYGHKQKKNYKRGILLSIIAGAFFFDELLNFRFNVFIAILLIFIGAFFMFRDHVHPEWEDENDSDDEMYHDQDEDERYR